MLISELIIIVAAGCSTPIMENRTEFAWNSNDRWNLDMALPKCQKLYPKSPCLKKFIKVGRQDYQVVCAKEL